ncbi:hypothetical protein CI105_08095 [Candidatus Izimaplasma bacterium ZiA1]|uniref:hypothetical protein n=1 Tax=Candidatus Izimoplasma sp. ZiA1 TaxID=2024899 RepID=UPI000BAA54F2|nr:hypothetical protein CI105_08095 [Candidatus Izimaplasma bacterium ZiA1]
MKIEIFKKIFKYNEEKNEFLLEMSLNNFDEMFDDWDASIIRKKDLDPELVDYLIEAVTELPYKAKIGISFRLHKKHKDIRLEEITKTVFTNYFTYQIHLKNRQVYRLLKRASIYLILGFIFILFAYNLENNTTEILFDVLAEGLFIGGWVFVWESISLLFFKIKSVLSITKKYSKIINSRIYFNYLE